MKLSKYAKLVKSCGICTVFHVESDGIWLATNTAVYRAPGLPESIDAEAMAAVLDFDEKQARKIVMRDKYCEDMGCMIEVDLREDPHFDIGAKRLKVSAVCNGSVAVALLCDDGDLVFYDDALTGPLSDVFKESDYVETVVRMAQNGRRYVVVKDGFDIIAAFAPMNVITEDYIGELEEFHTLCATQLIRDQERAAQRAQYEAEATGQMSVGETEDQ